MQANTKPIQPQSVTLKRSEDSDGRYLVYLSGIRAGEVLGGNKMWTMTSLNGDRQLQGTRTTRIGAVKAYLEAFPEALAGRFQ